jgi:hypothetical protein
VGQGYIYWKIVLLPPEEKCKKKGERKKVENIKEKGGRQKIMRELKLKR